nr:hypothetical protein Iba_chr05dCG11090 [Ipomoea batatas]
MPGFYSTGLAPPDQSQVPPSPNLCVNQGNWSDIQRWFDENHAEERGLTPPPRELHLSQRDVDIAHQPRVEDYDKDYLRYLQELPEEEDEEHHISSIQENEPEEPRYTPRAPNQYSDTRECWLKKDLGSPLRSIFGWVVMYVGWYMCRDPPSMGSSHTCACGSHLFSWVCMCHFPSCCSVYF